MKNILIFLSLLILASCTKPNTSLQSSGSTISRSEMLKAIGDNYALSSYFGDSTYAMVDAAGLAGYYDSFRQRLFDDGIVKWEPNFDCNHFASYYVALANTRYAADHFQTLSSSPQSLAIGTFWYQSSKGPHAIVVALTNQGTIFIEPQTGKQLILTQQEKASAFLKVF